jgi:hypothetical protein
MRIALLIAFASIVSAAELKLPDGGFAVWVLVPTCEQALQLFDERGDVAIFVDGAVGYDEGQKATVITRRGGCAEVKLAKNGLSGFVKSELAPVTQEETRALAAEAARIAAIAKLPMLDSGMSAAFVGSDRKCSEEFQQALAMEGVEKRKRIAELVSYHCGFIVGEPRAHVLRLNEDRGFCEVRLASGKHAGESGWSPCAWIRP